MELGEDWDKSDLIKLNMSPMSFHETETDEFQIWLALRLYDLDLQFTSEVFGRSFAHDIANPLTAININIDFLKKVLLDFDNREVVIETLNATKRLIGDINSKINKVRYHSIIDLKEELNLNLCLPYFMETLDRRKVLFYHSQTIFKNISLILMYLFRSVLQLSLDRSVVQMHVFYFELRNPFFKFIIEFNDSFSLDIKNNPKMYELENFNLINFELSKFAKLSSKYDITYNHRVRDKMIFIDLG